MTCPYCGAENDASYQFCQSCGARLTAQTPKAAPQPRPYQPQLNAYQPQQPPQPYQPQPAAVASVRPPKAKKPMPKLPDLKQYLPKNPKKLLLPAAAVLAVLVVGIAVACLLTGGNGGFQEVTSLCYALPYDDETLLFRDGKQLDDTMDGRIIDQSSSLDGSVSAYLTSVDSSLYLVTGKKITLVSEDVSMFHLSDDGSTLAYTDHDGELTVMNTKNHKSSHVAEDVFRISLSPDGKTVVYVSREDDDEIVYRFDGKESEELGENMHPLVVSDGGKYIYYFNREKGALYVMDSKGNSTKVASDLNTMLRIRTNSDHSQVMFNAGGKWYVSENGDDKVKIYSKGDVFQLVPPTYGAGCQNYNGITLETVGAESFGGNFFVSQDTLYFLTRKLDSDKVASDITSVRLTPDGSTAFYLRDSGKLYKVTARNYDDPEEVTRDVKDFRITSDGSAVYFLDYDNTLWYQKGSKEAVRIEEDVDKFYMTYDDCCLYMCDYKNNAGDLFVSRNGSKGEDLMEDCHSVSCYPGVTYITADYDDGEVTLYAAKKATKPELIFEP